LGEAKQTLQDSTAGVIQGASGAIGSVTDQAGKTIGGAIDGTGKTLGGIVEGTTKVVSNTQKAVGETFIATTQTVGTAIETAQKQVGETMKGTGQIISDVATGTTQLVGSSVQYSTQIAGSLIHGLDQNPELEKLTHALKLDWLLPIINKVDVQGAAAAVQDLQTQYPHESVNQITHRLIQQKALLVGGMGLASSLVPGAAAALFTVDLAALAFAQAELGYQIAAAYGLDLSHPARKGEILAIFGAAMGANYAFKTGLKFALRNVPIAGGAVGASTNAIALYAVGYAACRFHETQGQALLTETAAQQALEAGAEYLEAAQQQQVLVDQVIAHMVKASFPDRTWAETLPELEPYHLSAESLATIEAHLDNPIPLADLISNLTEDYSIVALFTCQAIANADENITPEEDAILAALSTQLE